MTGLLSVLALMSLSVPCSLNGGVLLPDGEPFSEQALLFEGGTVEQLSPPDTVFSSFLSEQLPPSDKGQFWIVLYWDSRSPESRQLLHDFGRHPSLRALAEWGKLVTIDRSGTPSAEAKHLAMRLEKADVPTVLVMAHPGHPLFGRPDPDDITDKREWKYAYATSGYGGDAAMLARNIYDGLVQQYQQAGVSAEQCPGPWCPDTPDPRDPGKPSWPPVQPDRDGWDTPALPAIPGLDKPIVGVEVPGWAIGLFIGVVATLVLLAIYRRSAVVLIVVCLIGGTAMAEDPFAGPYESMTGESVEGVIDPGATNDAEASALDEPIERADLYPPLPDGWEWLDRSVRDEVRRAIDPPRYEAWFRASIVHIENRIDSAVSGVRGEVHQAVERHFFWQAVGITIQAATVGLLLYAVWLIRQWG